MVVVVVEQNEGADAAGGVGRSRTTAEKTNDGGIWMGVFFRQMESSVAFVRSSVRSGTGRERERGKALESLYTVQCGHVYV